jgi:succinyl-CoA synthetase beta subunit
VRLARIVEEAAEFARQMLGRTLVTVQTGPAGKQVNRIYIEDGSDIERELYLALLIDRKTSRISIVASTEGGMDIEDVAHDTPEKILTFTIDPATGLQDFHGRRVAFALGLTGNQVKQCVQIVKEALPAVPRQGHGHAGDQPACGDEGRPAQASRCQDGL